jgi:hypothetical protein
VIGTAFGDPRIMSTRDLASASGVEVYKLLAADEKSEHGVVKSHDVYDMCDGKGTTSDSRTLHMDSTKDTVTMDYMRGDIILLFQGYSLVLIIVTSIALAMIMFLQVGNYLLCRVLLIVVLIVFLFVNTLPILWPHT